MYSSNLHVHSHQAFFLSRQTTLQWWSANMLMRGRYLRSLHFPPQFRRELILPKKAVRTQLSLLWIRWSQRPVTRRQCHPQTNLKQRPTNIGQLKKVARISCLPARVWVKCSSKYVPPRLGFPWLINMKIIHTQNPGIRLAKHSLCDRKVDY